MEAVRSLLRRTRMERQGEVRDSMVWPTGFTLLLRNLSIRRHHDRILSSEPQHHLIYLFCIPGLTP